MYRRRASGQDEPKHGQPMYLKSTNGMRIPRVDYFLLPHHYVLRHPNLVLCVTDTPAMVYCHVCEMRVVVPVRLQATTQTAGCPSCNSILPRQPSISNLRRIAHNDGPDAGMLTPTKDRVGTVCSTAFSRKAFPTQCSENTSRCQQASWRKAEHLASAYVTR